MRLKKSRIASFAALAVVYVSATVIGLMVYMALPFDFYIRLLAADVAATAFTFIFSLLFKNASVYDPYWSVQPIVILFGFALFYEMTLPRLLMLTAVTLWGVRLTVNWAYTFKGLCHQDWRYTMLEKNTGVFYPLINLVGIHLVPTLVVYGCTLPAVCVFVYDTELNLACIPFFVLCVLAATLQGTADAQMHAFRKNPDGNFIRRGLWKYSRHPNYLGEILMWWGIGLFCLCLMPQRWYLLSGALANTLLFVFVSLPMAEKRQSKKEGFADYKKATRLLLPIIK